MPSDGYTPRFSFEITEEQKVRATKLIAYYGLRKAIFSHILDDVLDMIEQYGPQCLGVLMTGEVKPREVIATMHKAEEVVKDGQP